MKIAITGASGFLGSHLTEYFLSLGHTVKEITRSTVDLTSGQEVEKWFLENGPIDCVIHTAINGGRAEDTDNIKSFTENLQMYYTLSSQKDHFKVMINFCSGAAFDRREEIQRVEEKEIIRSTPVDLYGLAKNMIARDILHLNSNIINLRLFGVFGENEHPNRLFKSLIRGIQEDTEFILDVNKKMDFVYVGDVCRAVEYCVTHHTEFIPRDLNIVYDKKITLGSMFHILEDILGSSNDLIMFNKSSSEEYTGDPGLSRATFPAGTYLGIKHGLRNMCFPGTSK
jgi:nucleoside-diphosphate-sugar epimerase